jgi:hypothetical protein
MKKKMSLMNKKVKQLFRLRPWAPTAAYRVETMITKCVRPPHMRAAVKIPSLTSLARPDDQRERNSHSKRKPRLMPAFRRGCRAAVATPASRLAARRSLRILPRVPGQPDRLRLGGRLALAFPFGTFFPPNISPDERDGIGAWRTIDLANALMSGVHCGSLFISRTVLHQLRAYGRRGRQRPDGVSPHVLCGSSAS